MYPNRNIVECNHELSSAISKSMIVLGYFELPEEEIPSEAIWDNHEKLEAWWKEVKSNRNDPKAREKAEWENVDLEQNDLTKDFR